MWRRVIPGSAVGKTGKALVREVSQTARVNSSRAGCLACTSSAILPRGWIPPHSHNASERLRRVSVYRRYRNTSNPRWRTDKYLRNLEAMMIVADAEQLLILTGNGDVLEPEGGIAAIGSGGNYALAAARALSDYEQDPEVLARRAMQIASEVCVFTNDRLTLETVEG